MIIQGDLFTGLTQKVLNKAKSLLKSENEAMLVTLYNVHCTCNCTCMAGLRVPRTEAGFLTFAGMRNNRSGPLLVPLAGDREGGVEGIVLSLESLAKGLALMAGIQTIVAARHITKYS